METTNLIIYAVASWRKYGWNYTRNWLWNLRYSGKITDSQLLKCFKTIHEKE